MSETEEFADQEYRESFGDFLKRHREASGKSIDDVSRVTRIPKRFLNAFEENDLSRFPEDAFARGFLRSYSMEIGLDLDEVMSRYERFRRSLMPTQIKEIKKVSQFAELGNEGPQPFKWSSRLSWGVVAVLLILTLTLAGSLMFGRKSSESSQKQEEGDSSGSDLVEPEATNTLAAPVAESAKSLSIPVTPMTLSLTAKKRTKIQVRLDEHPLVDVNFEEGDTKSYNVFKEIEVKSLEKSAFQILYDGKAVEAGSPNLKLVNRNLFVKPVKSP